MLLRSLFCLSFSVAFPYSALAKQNGKLDVCFYDDFCITFTKPEEYYLCAVSLFMWLPISDVYDLAVIVIAHKKFYFLE